MAQAAAASHEATQKKTFQRWVNLKLTGAGYTPIQDITRDLASGEKLAELLIAISDSNSKVVLAKMEKIAGVQQPAAIYLKKVGNVNKCLQYIKDNGVRFENIGAEDLVGRDQGEPNVKLTLGIVWNIIDKWDISSIADENSSAKDALLKWCQRKTKDALYRDQGVNITNFDRSWKDGLAFCALIHAHKPNLIPFETLNAANAAANLELAFKTAEELGIPRLLDVEDIMDNVKPDDKSVMSYVAQYFKYFSLGNKADLGAKSIAAMAKFNREMQAAQDEYMVAVKPLAAWIAAKQQAIAALDCKNTMEDVLAAGATFTAYHDSEKPPKALEFLRVQNLYNTVQLRLRNANRVAFEPGPGLTMNELDQEWADLAKIEHQKNLEIGNEKKRQEKIADTTQVFQRKIESLSEWITRKNEYLSKREHISSITAANTMLKLHESFEKEYKSNKARLEPLEGLLQQLQQLNAKNLPECTQQAEEAKNAWAELLALSLAKKKYIDDGLAREKLKDHACKEYAEYAKDGRHKLKNKLLGLKKTGFGTSLSEVTHYQEVMTEEEKEINADIAKILRNLDQAQARMDELGMTEDEKYRYTSIRKSDVASGGTELQAALATRRKDWERALQQQEDMETKRKEYARLAEELEAKVRRKDPNSRSFDDAETGSIYKGIHRVCSQDMPAEPEECLELIKEEYDQAAIDAELAEVVRVDRESREMGITTNEYTQIEVPTLTADVKYLHAWVAKYREELALEQADKEKYAADSKELRMALTVAEKEQADLSALKENTLAAVTAAMKQFQSWRINDKAKYAAQLAKLVDLRRQIMQRIQNGPTKEPLLMDRPPFRPQIDIEDNLQVEWRRLQTAEATRLSKFEMELRVQTQLEQLARAFNLNATELEKWIASTVAYLKQTEKIETLETATLHLTAFDSITATFRAYQDRRTALERIVADIAAPATFAGHYKKLPEIEERLQNILDQFKELPALEAAKKKALTEAKLREQEKEQARITYAHTAGDLKTWLKQQTLRINTAAGGFGNTLKEVRDTRDRLNADVAAVKNDVDVRMADMLSKWDKLQQLGVSSSDLGHTTITCEELESLQHQLVDRQHIRDAQLQAELVKQEHMESARLIFASAAAALGDGMEKMKADLERLSGPAKTVLTAIPDVYPGNLDELMAEVKAANADCQAKGVKDNEHTDLTEDKLNSRRQDLSLWVASFEFDLEEEHRELQKYNMRAAELTSWIAKDIALLKQRIAASNEAEADLLAVRSAIDQHQAWRTSEKANNSAIQGELRLQKDKIELLLREAARKRPRHLRPPFTPAEGQTIEEIDAAWNLLEMVDADRAHKLQEQLARQEKMFMLNRTFEESLEALTKWVTEKEVYFSEEKPILDLVTAQVLVSELDATEVEIKTNIAKRKALEDLVKQLNLLHCKDIASLEARCNAIVARFNDLWREPPAESLASKKRVRLNAAVAREQLKEMTRNRWAADATKFGYWFKARVLDINGTSSKFGNSLQALEAFRAILVADDKEVAREIQQREDAAKALWAELEGLGIGPGDLHYTATVLSDLLELTQQRLPEALQQRTAAYEAELKRQQAMEAKRKEFAAAAAAHIAECDRIDALCKQLSGDPDVVISKIALGYREGEMSLQLLAEVERLDNECKSMLITENVYTKYSLAACKTRQESIAGAVGSFRAELAEEKQDESNYTNDAERLADWLDAMIVKLADVSLLDNTLKSVKDAVQAFKDWNRTEKAEYSALKSMCENKWEQVKFGLANGRYTRELASFQPGRGLLLSELQASWAQMEAVEQERHEKLQAELIRQEKLTALRKHFDISCTELLQFIDAKEKYLGLPEQIVSLETAQTELAALQAALREVDEWTSKRNAIAHSAIPPTDPLVANATGTPRASVPRTPMSPGSRVVDVASLAPFETMVSLQHRDILDITAKAKALVSRFDLLNGSASVKMARIQDALAIEQGKEDARLHWAKLAHNYILFQKNRMLGITLVRESFGCTLMSVIDYKQTLEADVQQATAADDDHLRLLTEAWDDMHGRGIVDEKDKLRHSDRNLSDLKQLSADLRGKLVLRTKAYEAELARQHDMEETRILFANAAESLQELCNKSKAAIEAMRTEPEAVLKFLDSKYPVTPAVYTGPGAAPAPEGEEIFNALNAVVEANKLIDSKGITFNDHTMLSLDNCMMDVEMFKAFVSSYRDSLEEEQSRKRVYDSKAEALNKWIESAIAQYATLKTDNTLAGVMAAYSEFNTWRATTKATKNALHLEAQGLARDLAVYMDEHKKVRPAFAPALTIEELDARWDQLLATEEAYDAAVTAELQRQQRLFARHNRFKDLIGDFETWLTEKEAYAQSNEDLLTSLAGAIQELTVTDLNTKDLLENVGQNTAIQQLASELQRDNYVHAAEVTAQATAASARFDDLSNRLAPAKRVRVQDVKTREEQEDATRVEWAKLCTDLALWHKSTMLTVNVNRESFGSTLSEVRDYLPTLEESERDLAEQIAQQLEPLTACWAKILHLKIQNDLKYPPQQSYDIVNASFIEDLRNRIAARQQAYKREFERQQAMEAKRLEFKSLCLEFVALKDTIRQSILSAYGDADFMQQAVVQYYQDAAPIKAMLARVAECDREAREVHYITTNEHTDYTLVRCENEAKALHQFITEFTDDMLEEQRSKTDFQTKATQLCNWITANIALLKDMSALSHNTLSAAQEAQMAFKTWRVTEKALFVAKKSDLETLFKLIDTQMLPALCDKYKPHKRPPFEPANSPTFVNAEWKKLTTAEEQRDELLNKELVRQEKIAGLVSVFNTDSVLFEQSIASLERSFGSGADEQKDVGDHMTLQAAQTMMMSLTATQKSIDEWKSKRTDLDKVTQQLEELQYKNAADTTAQCRALDVRFDALLPLAEKRIAAVRQTLERQQEREVQRVRWSSLVSDFRSWNKQQLVSLDVGLQRKGAFGTTLSKVQAHRTELDALHQQVASELQSRVDTLQQVWLALDTLGVVSLSDDPVKGLVYTSVKMPDIEKDAADLTGKLAARLAAYEAELVRQAGMETKMKTFAKSVEEFAALVEKLAKDVSSMSGEAHHLIRVLDPESKNFGTLDQEESKKDALERHRYGQKELATMMSDLERQEQSCLADDITDGINLELVKHLATLWSNGIEQVVDELYEERKEKRRYDRDAEALREWIQANLKVLEDFATLDANTLEAAQAAVAKHKEWQADKAERAVRLVSLGDLSKAISRGLSDKIALRQKSAARELSREERLNAQQLLPLRAPFEPTIAVAALQSEWDQLEQVAAARSDRLNKELIKQEHLTVLYNSFVEKSQDLRAFITDKRAEFTDEASLQSVDSLEKARLYLDTNETIYKEVLSANPKNSPANSKPQTIAALAAEIRKLSHRNQAEIDATADALVKDFDELSNLYAARKERLLQLEKLGEAKAAAAQRFVEDSIEFIQWSKEQIDQISQYNFGSDFDSVNRYGVSTLPVLNETDERQCAEKYGAASEAFAEAVKLGVKEKDLGQYNQASLDKANAAFATAIQERNTAYAQRLAQVNEQDEAARSYAKAAEAFTQWLSEHKKQIWAVQGEASSRVAAMCAIYLKDPSARSPASAAPNGTNFNFDAAAAAQAQAVTAVTPNENLRAFAEYQKCEALDLRCKQLAIKENPHTQIDLVELYDQFLTFKSLVDDQLLEIEKEKMMAEAMAALQERMARIEKEDKLRMEYAEKAQGLLVWGSDVIDVCSEDLSLAKTVEQIDAQEKRWFTVQAADKEMRLLADQAEAKAEEMRAEGVKDFGGFDPVKIREDYASWVQKLKQRKDALVEEKRKQIRHQSLREAYIKAANILDDFITQKKRQMAPELLKGKSFEEQMAVINLLKTECHGKGRNDGERLYANLKSADEAMVAAGIDADLSLQIGLSSPSSPAASPMSPASPKAAAARGVDKDRILSRQALTVEFDALKDSIEERLKLLDAELAKQVQGNSVDDINELREIFMSCDKGNKGYLKKDEFLQCLTCLGEYVDPSEADDLVRKVDTHNTGSIVLKDLATYYASLKKEGQTEEEMIASFVAMGADKIVTRQQLSAALDAATVDFLCSVMPQKGAGYDYVAYCASAFRKGN